MFPFTIRKNGKLKIHPPKRCCIMFISHVYELAHTVGTDSEYNDRYAIGTDESMDANSSGDWGPRGKEGSSTCVWEGTCGSTYWSPHGGSNSTY